MTPPEDNTVCGLHGDLNAAIKSVDKKATEILAKLGEGAVLLENHKVRLGIVEKIVYGTTTCVLLTVIGYVIKSTMNSGG